MIFILTLPYRRARSFMHGNRWRHKCVVHRILNTNSEYSSASFTVIFDKKNLTLHTLFYDFWQFGSGSLFWTTICFKTQLFQCALLATGTSDKFVQETCCNNYQEKHQLTRLCRRHSVARCGRALNRTLTPNTRMQTDTPAYIYFY